MKKSLQTVLVTAVVVAIVSGLACAQMSPDAGRQALSKVDAAVVSVRVVTKMTTAMEGREAAKEDHEVEVTGCVIDPKGLTAVSLSMTDPAAMYEGMFEGMADMPDVKFQSEITDLKIRYAEGSEVSAEVAIRDKDLDVAILRPKTALAAPVAAVDLSGAAAANLLDQLLVVSRRGKAVSYATIAQVKPVVGMLTKPRKMYLMQGGLDELQREFGSLVVNSDGKPVGLQMLRKTPSAGEEGPEMLAVVLPASDIVAIAKQIGQ